MIKLRDYQSDLVSKIRTSYQAGKKAVLAVAPTGAGKTVIFSHIAASVAARGKRVIVLVHRVELLRQTSAALSKSGVDHSLINPKFTPDYRKSVQVASVQTLVKRLHMMPKPDLIVVDECHHANAGSWRKIIAEFPTAHVLGVTATPIRGDGTGLGVDAGGVFDDLVEGPQVPWLISKGYLVKPVVYAPMERLDLKGIKVVRGDYDQTELAKAVDKPKITGDAVQHYKRLCPGAPAVVFCVSIAHAMHVADEFRGAGFRAYPVDGSMEDDIRKRILGGLGNGSVDVVCSCDLISEGTDIPAIGCAILLRPTQSTGLFLQQVGRALRTCEGKDRAIILDHVGNVLVHGLPEEFREWSLEGEIKKKKKKGDKQEVKVQVRQCEKCFVMHEPAPVCPSCGFIYSVKQPIQEEGELRQMTAEEEIIVKRNRNKEVAKAGTLEELNAIAKARGYKPGWATYIWQSREKKKAQHSAPAI